MKRQVGNGTGLACHPLKVAVMKDHRYAVCAHPDIDFHYISTRHNGSFDGRKTVFGSLLPMSPMRYQSRSRANGL